MVQSTGVQRAYLPEFDATRSRWSAFWRGESARPMLHAIRPRAGATPIDRPRPYDGAFGDVDALVEQALGWAATHEFLGDAIPSFMITFTPDHFAALLGADITPGAGTNWVKPCLSSLDDVAIDFQRDGRWWRRTVEVAEKFRARCDGQLIITATHLQGGLDCLVALYGAENLFMDMAMAPEKVHTALEQIDTALAEVRTAFAELLDVNQFGSLNRFGMYSPGIIDVPQCDASCMISEQMFGEFQLPYLAREIATTDHSVYHLDGIGAVQHTEAICSIESLDMIQWMPGAGHYDDDHTELNRRIDALGKGQIFQLYYKLTDDRVREIWETFKSRKLFFQVEPEQCERLLQQYAAA